MKSVQSWLLAVSMVSGMAQAAQVCNLVFDQCPGNFTSGTITVPQNVIWLDPVVPVCSENVQVVTGTNAAPPSIVFIIDNSGSMSNGNTDNSNNGGNDPDEARFKVVSDLLDTIFTASPTAEVGLAIFTRRLQFDNRDNPYYKPAFPADTSQHDAFVPLTALNKVFPDGKRGLDTLKALLKYTGNGNLDYATKRQASRTNNTGIDPFNTRDGTDITLGFDAAKEAIKTAKAAVDNQYFIFLSDGEPTGVDEVRKARQNDFVNGTATPTTFTVFFDKDNDTDSRALTTIRTMTENIKANGYSQSNSKSNYWLLNIPGSQLLALLQSSVLNPILANTPGKPVSAVMAVGGTNYNSTGVDAKNFTFAKRVPLSADQTQVTLTYTYSYVDSGKTKQKTVPYTLAVKRSNAGSPLGAGLASSCQEQGDITLYNNGSPIKIVTADHSTLDVHLTLANGETCNGCSVEVKPDKSGDKENVVLAPAGGAQVGRFGRETSTRILSADGVLQHLPADSIVVTYVNPDNPLDVIRKSFPYSDFSTTLTVLRHNDYSRGGDVVPPVSGQQFVLVAPAGLDASSETGARNWSITPALATPADSLRYVGNVIEASRAFKVEIRIYSNLGQFVNKIEFTVPQSEFVKLSKGIKNNTRRLKVLWDNRAADGSLAGTGAYILKTTVTLLKIPGIAEDEAVTTDYRIVGVLRSP